MADATRDSAPKTIQLKNYTPPNYLVDTVALEFDLDANATLVSSRLAMRRNPAAAAGNALVLNGNGPEIVRLAIDGRELAASDYRIEDETLTIDEVAESVELEVVTRIDPSANTALEGLYMSHGMFCTQCEAEGFRRITWYPDRPDVLARFTTTIRADKTRFPVLLSNGNAVERGTDGDRHWVTWQDPHPKPCYLFALVAGDLVCVNDQYTTRSGREVALEIYTEARNRDKCAHAMRSLQQAMQWDEQTFGLEYDLDIYMIVAVEHFNMGAMENKGLNIFNAKYVLASPETATDTDFENIQGVIGHEYFHNWTGNRVTCRDWFQLSLKEGLTVFRDQEFSADMTSRAVKRIADVRMLRAAQFAEDSGPMAHPVRPETYIEINNFYTLTVYEKGAELIRMMHTLLGAENFRKGMDLYFQRHDGQAVTTEDFAAAMQDASGIDLGHFRRWYAQAGTPQVSINGEYDAAARRYSLHIEQHTPPTPGQVHKQPLHIPVAVALLDRDGNDIVATLLELHEARQSFHFDDIDAPPVPSLLRGFSAPVKLTSNLTDADLAFLMANDNDSFTRWDASQQLALKTLLQLVDAHAAGREAALDTGFIDAVRGVLTDHQTDPALLAEALSLPSESYIGDQMQTVAVDAIHAARQRCRDTLAHELRDTFYAVYERNRVDDAYAPTPVQTGKRRLRNTALGYIARLSDSDAQALCAAHYREATNMTDAMSGLMAVVHNDNPYAEQALAHFYERWQADSLVIDKWFSLQATSPAADTFARVQTLMQHADFDLGTPNRVRALIGAFCHANPVRFHAANGEGYRFLADQVVALNATNPQVAARLLGALTRWRRYDSARQQRMQAELQRIVEHAGLSKDVYEVASKSLQ